MKEQWVITDGDEDDSPVFVIGRDDECLDCTTELENAMLFDSMGDALKFLSSTTCDDCKRELIAMRLSHALMLMVS